MCFDENPALAPGFLFSGTGPSMRGSIRAKNEAASLADLINKSSLE